MPNNNNYGRPQHQGGGRGDQPKPSADLFRQNNPFKKEWITIGADEEMVTFTDKAGKFMEENNLTSSQIRNIFGEMKRIQLKKVSSPEGRVSFMLLKPKVAYAYGRQKNEGLKLFKTIFDKAWPFVEGQDARFDNFTNLIEAIVAYHKAYGGK